MLADLYYYLGMASVYLLLCVFKHFMISQPRLSGSLSVRLFVCLFKHLLCLQAVYQFDYLFVRMLAIHPWFVIPAVYSFQTLVSVGNTHF